MSLLSGKLGIVFGVANKRSIAWAIAQSWAREGAKLAFTYQGERLKENVEELAGTFGADTLILPCDVTKDEDIASVFKTVGENFGRLDLMLHSVAFAPKDALEGEFVNTSREAFRVAHDVSAYSLATVGVELDAIAAVVIGGALLSGGAGGMLGSLFGVLIQGLILTYITFDGSLSSWWARIVIGALLFVFIGLQKLIMAGSAARPAGTP